MNIFIPQCYQTRIELEQIADVQKQIITPALSVPIMGIVQDGLLGGYHLTQSSTNIDWKTAMNIISYTSVDDFSKIKKTGTVKGSDLFSLIIPSRINNSGAFEVENGTIKNGYLSSAMLGATKSHSLIHMIWDEYGFEETRKFIDNTQRLINNFLLWNGCSVGFGDTVISAELEDQLYKMIKTKKLEIDHQITEKENNPDLIPDDIFEASIQADLSAVRPNATKSIISQLSPMNNFNVMINSGSKGGPDNVGMMSGCLGQQVLEGKRLPKKYNNRAMAYFHQNDDSASGRGFIERPYARGLSAIEFIFHNMASREGLIDTAIKTAESGYLQRKLIKRGEDDSVKYDRTVRNSNHLVHQWIYGDTGIDPSKQASYVLKMLELGNTELARLIKFTDTELKNYNFSQKDNEQYFNDVKHLRNVLRVSKLKTAINNISFNPSYMLPINIKTIVTNIKNSTSKNEGVLEPKYIVDKIKDILDYKNTKVTCMTKAEYENPNTLRHLDETMAKSVFQFALYEILSPKQLLLVHGLKKSKFDELVDKIIKQFNNAVVVPGEMVGIVGAQSIGEPITQIN